LSSENFLNLSDNFMPETQPPDNDPPQPSMRAPNKKALTIGINYLSLQPGRGRLSGCINDSDTMVSILKDTFGFQDHQIQRLRDDQASMMPTKANILNRMQWLTQGAANGDELFLHYSGHGGQQRDTKGDERDGKDETILPCDFQHAGQITDDDLHAMLVDSLPRGVRLWVIMDCCHSGTCLDLSYKITMNSRGEVCCKKKHPYGRRRNVTKPKAEVIMISGCKDTQTSADIGAGTAGVAKAAGAMTTAFRHCCNRNVACEDLLTSMRAFLKQNGFDQVPQMSSDNFVQLDVPFVNYQEKKPGKRELPASLLGNSGGGGGGNFSPMSPQQIGYPQDFGSGDGSGGLDDRLKVLEAEISALRSQNPPSPMGGSMGGGSMMGPGGMMGSGQFNPPPSSWGGQNFGGQY